MPKQIKTIEELKEIVPIGKSKDCFLVCGGFCRSSKNMYRISEDKWEVLNEIDDTYQTLTSKQLFNNKLTNIGEAMKLGAFYQY